MTPEERITQLEQRIASLEGRIAKLEAERLTQKPYGPIPTPYYPPTNPYPYAPVDPWVPPYTITCKLADGTTKEIKLDSPIVAY